MMPRPWFLSLTAIWNDDEIATQKLNESLLKLGYPAYYPQHHVEVRQEARHLTVFAILRINTLPSTESSFRDLSRNLLAELTSDTHMFSRLNDLLKAPLTLSAYEIRVFDNGTVLQFQGKQDLATLRHKAHAIFAEPVERLVSSHGKDIIYSLVDDSKKSSGDHAHGSIARSPDQSDMPTERFREALPLPIAFNFSRIHLLISDESLTNPRIADRDDFIIGR